jgi:hypothetical protein
MQLRLIIENTPADEILPVPANASSDFIEAALRTARYSKSMARERILSDVCDILNCREEDLTFLFEHSPVPRKSRPVMGLELPDYRMSQSEIYKLAAE